MESSDKGHPSPCLCLFSFYHLTLCSSSDLAVADVEKPANSQEVYPTAAIFGGVFLALVVAVAAFTLGRKTRTARGQPPSTKM